MTSRKKLSISLVFLAAAIIVLMVIVGVARSQEGTVDVDLRWDASAGVTGYKIYMSTDNGTSWSVPVDVGNTLNHTYTGVPDIGLILFRVSAYNTQGESIRFWSGAWYCEDWKPVLAPTGTGIN